MRPLEILILALDLAAILALILPTRSKLGWSKFLPSVSLGVTLVHLALERYRWQMAPAYLLTGALFLFTLPRLTRAAESRPRKTDRLASRDHCQGFTGGNHEQGVTL